MKSHFFPFLILLGFLLVARAASAAEVVALVIGNNAYTRAEDVLDTPIADAELMQRTLAALPGGADVKILRNASKEEIEIALNQLKVRAKGAKLALVFYSGHGMDGQPDGFPREDTFLLPVEAVIPDVNYLDTRAVSLTKVLNALRDSPVTARAVILDCCRTGAPKATAALAGSTKNFGDLDERVKAALGKAIVPEATLVAFAASPGRKAAAFLKNSDTNSPFTTFLAAQLATGTGNLRDLVEAAAEETETRTGRRQVPYVEYKGAATAIRQIVFRLNGVVLPVLVPRSVDPVPGGDSYNLFAGKVAGERKLIEVAAGVSVPFRWCPAGTFMMGSPESEKAVLKAGGKEVSFYSNEVEHKVTLTKGFWLAETEVTQGQWQGVMKSTLVQQANEMLADDMVYKVLGDKTIRDYRSSKKGEGSKEIGVESEKIAMYFVNWVEAEEFCVKASRHAGMRGWRMALPTEAQWEYACRAGTTGMTYVGDFTIKGEHNAPGLDPIAWYGGNSSAGYNGVGWATTSWKEKQYPGETAGIRKVGAKKANAWGLNDMLGNVWEWTGDYYAAYPSGNVIDPQGAASGADRVNRGGSWNLGAADCRAAVRDRGEPGIRGYDLGFRPALVPSG